jgi:HK97 family phage prohead protease
MEDTAPLELDGALTHRVATIGMDSAAESSPAAGLEVVYSALAYRYEETDTYNTTMARGAMSHVVPDDFRILEFHKQDRDPVAKPVSCEETTDGLLVRFVFADTERAQELRALVDTGFLRAVSVGFIAVDGFIRPDGVTVFTKVDLHELSLVNTPSSKGALIQLSREIGAEQADLEAIFGELPEDAVEEITERDTEAEMDAAIESLRSLGVDETTLALLRVTEAVEEIVEVDTIDEIDPEAAEIRARMMRNLGLLRHRR